MFDLDKVCELVGSLGLDFERGLGDDGVDEVAVFTPLSQSKVFWPWVLYVRKRSIQYVPSDPDYIGDVFEAMREIQNQCWDPRRLPEKKDWTL